MSKYYQAESAVVVGDVTLAEDVGIWHNATIRGDMAPILIGARTNIQDNSVLHVDTNLPLTIGQDVTIGHGAILHGCTIGDKAMVGMGSIVLNGAKIGKGALVAAGTLVLENTEVPDGAIIMGSPGKIRGEVTSDQTEGIQAGTDFYVEEARKSLPEMEV